MGLEQLIQKDMVEAMKAKDQVRLDVIRSIKSAILLGKTAEGAGELTDGDILKMIQKLIKQHQDTAEQFMAAGRPEQADKEKGEISILEKYLPKQLSEADVEAKLKEIIAQVGAAGIKDMGKVMGVATKSMAGQADGKLISALVRKLLA